MNDRSASHSSLRRVDANSSQGIAPLAQFPEYPGTPNHATYDKFDAASQLVSTSGDHAWITPGKHQIFLSFTIEILSHDVGSISHDSHSFSLTMVAYLFVERSW
jgi:hypothetical protein